MKSISVIHTFRKMPTAKNLARRSLSFVESEIQHVGNNDLVVIAINGTKFATEIKVDGKSFLNGLQDKTAKNGTKVKVFQF